MAKHGDELVLVAICCAERLFRGAELFLSPLSLGYVGQACEPAYNLSLRIGVGHVYRMQVTLANARVVDRRLILDPFASKYALHRRPDSFERCRADYIDDWPPDDLF